MIFNTYPPVSTVGDSDIFLLGVPVSGRQRLRNITGADMREAMADGMSPIYAQTVYVVQDGGSDVTGEIGKISKPYQNIDAAYDAITDAAEENRYVIRVEAGIYNPFEAKKFVCLKGSSKPCVQVYGTSGTLISFAETGPGEDCSISNMTVVLAPETDVEKVIKLNEAGVYTLDNIDIKINSSTAGISLISVIDAGNAVGETEITMKNSYAIIRMAGTSAGTKTHKFINTHDNVGFLSIGNTIGYFIDDIDDDLIFWYDDATGQVSVTGLTAFLIAQNASFTGSITGYKCVKNNTAPKDFRNSQISLIGFSGNGTGTAFEADTATGVNISATGSNITVVGFANQKAAKTSGANDVINTSFSSISAGSDPFNDTIGTINYVISENNELILNTGIIDKNLIIPGTSPTNDSLGNFLNIIASAGWVSGGEKTDNGDGSMQVAAGTGIIKTSNDEQAPNKTFDWEADTNVSLTDGVVNYVFINYNAATPIVAVTTTITDVNGNDKFGLWSVVREGIILHFTDWRQIAKGVPERIQEYLYSISKLKRADSDGGLILGEIGTRNPTMSAGKLWSGLNPIPITGVDCSGADTFDRYYTTDSGATWTMTTGNTQWSNTLYNNITTGEATISNAKYSFQDFYADADGKLVSLYAQEEYNSKADATAAPTSSIFPPRITEHAIYIGRIVFQESDATALSILSAFLFSFTPASASDHSTLSNRGWTIAGHTGAANTSAGFGASGEPVTRALPGTLTINPQTSAYTLTNSDDIVRCVGTFTITGHAIATATIKRYTLKNDGTGVITFDPNLTETIDGQLTIAIYPGDSLDIVPYAANSDWMII